MRSWNDFDRFQEVIDIYMPWKGEGETMASQICTAVNKLVYKWYNDGDVFNNTSHLDGWCNDLSSYANWLDKNTDAGDLLEQVYDCYIDGDYEDLLYNLCEMLLNTDDLEVLNSKKAVGSIYDCDGQFRFEEPQDEEEDW